jgi:hypothetical protein
MDEAIILAIEKGGYEKHRMFHSYADTTHDPLFWQALGKALGWDNKGYCNFGELQPCIHLPNYKWKDKAHQYFDLVLTDVDTEKFFKELIAVSERSESSAGESNA